MSYTTDEVLHQIEEEDVRFIRLAFFDAFGVQKNIAVMPGEVKKAFETGMPINAREIAGFADSPYASLYLKPDPDTLTILPWRSESGKTAIRQRFPMTGPATLTSPPRTGVRTSGARSI